MSSATKPIADPFADFILNPTPEERAQFRARNVEIADRSFIDSRMQIDLPPEWYGEWVSVDEFSQFNARARGMVDGSHFVPKDKFTHAHPEGGRIGDVQFMVMPKWQHEELEKAKQEQSRRRHDLSADRVGEAVKEKMRRAGINPDNDATVSHQIDGTQLAQVFNELDKT